MFSMHVTCDMHTTLYSQYCDMHASLNTHESCMQHAHYMQEISTRELIFKTGITRDKESCIR